MSVCPKATAQDPPSLFQNGNIVFQAHHVGWIVSSIFTLIAVVISFWLIGKHLQWYSNKREQRYIVRILFMVPIYAVISLASYFFWNNGTPLLLIRDAYESTVLTSFFYLLLAYLSPDPEEQRIIFSKAGLSRQADREALLKGGQPKKWVFPLGFIKWKPADGLLFLQGMKWGVLQYCVLRPTTTLAAVILDYMGLYCEDSWGLQWGHIYITIIVSLSVTVAMYCLLQLYVSVSDLLAPQKPLLKLFAIKAVVFLTFWQATFLSVLTLLGVVRNTQYMTADDINIGIGALLETFEMMLFALLHVKAFSYKPYRPFHHPDSKEEPPKRTSRLRSLAHAFDFRETFRELWQGWLYLCDKMRGRQPMIDSGARQFSHYEKAFGKNRPSQIPSILNVSRTADSSKDLPALPIVDIEKQASSPNARREWLGIRREKSEGLEAQIEAELNRRGYDTHIPGRGHIKPLYEEDAAAAHSRRRSWWRTVYDRISGEDPEEAVSRLPPSKKKRSKVKSQSRRDSDARNRLIDDHQAEFQPFVSPNETVPFTYSPLASSNVRTSGPAYGLDSPPPRSLLFPNVNPSDDGALGRIFNGVSSAGHGLDGLPDNRILPPSDYEIGMTNEREPLSQRGPSIRSIPVEIVNTDPVPSSSRRKSHRRESAFHGSPPTSPTRQGDPLSSNHSPTRSPRSPRDPPKFFSQPNSPIYTPHRSRRTSDVPIMSPERSHHRRQGRRYSDNHAQSRQKPPLMTDHSHYPQRHTHRPRHSVSGSNITQPSHSHIAPIFPQVQQVNSILARDSRYPISSSPPQSPSSDYDIYELR